ncbi:MAG: ABC transporter permease [Muricomes sp.]
MKEIENMEELDKNSVKEIWGCYGSYDFSDEYVQPLEEAGYASGTSNTSMTIQVVSDKYIQKLENYIRKNQLDIDIDSLSNGTGILVLHKHQLSEMSELNAKGINGMPAQVYSMDGEGNPEDKGVEFVCSGYLDTTIKGFPPLDMSWNGEGINYFLIGEKGFERLHFPKQIFGFSINAKKGQEALAKAKLTELIKKKNSEQKAVNIYSLFSTSDERARMEDYVNNTRTVMFALCLSLLLLGIINYLNVIITNMVSRKKEFVIMESVGMTKKQLKKMMIMEGLYYWGILLAALLSIGSLLIWGVGFMIKRNLSYFRFVYPVKELIIVAVILLLFCVLLPQVVYRKTSRKSAIEQLRNDG